MLERVAQLGGLAASLAIVIASFLGVRRESRHRLRSEHRALASEARLAITLDSIGDAVIATDAQGAIVWMNPVTEVLIGCRADEAAGNPLEECFRVVGDDGAPIAELIADVLGGRASLELAVLVSRDGRELPVHATAAPIRPAGGELQGAVLVFHDATVERDRQRLAAALRSGNEELERRVAERTRELTAANERLLVEMAERERASTSLTQAEDQLRQSQKLEGIGQLAGGVAHDFNNLLSVIVSYGEMLAEDLPEGEQREAAIEIHQAGHRAADLTRQLLAFSRRQVLAPKIVDLNHVVGGMSRLLQRLIGEHIDLRFVAGTISRSRSIRGRPSRS